MTQYSESQRKILAYLLDSASKGKQYFRSKNIATELGLSSKEVGVQLSKLSDESEEVTIEKWSRSRSTTWKINPN